MKHLLTTTTLLLLLTLPVAAQTQEKQITVTENVAYRTDVGPSTVLDVAQPLFGPQTNRPAILIIHGGGWSAGSKNDMVYRTLMVDYAMKGYVVCNMNYRLVQEAPLPACIEDVQAAVRWMKSNAQKLGIDPQRIGTYGHSAGGHLSLMAGLTAGVACAAGGAPPTEIGRAGEWADHKEWWPIGYIGKCATPFLVLQGGEDPTVRPNLTEDWVVKMQRAGTSVDYVKVHGNHGVAFDQQLEFTRPAMDAFYARHLKHDDPTVSFEQLKVPDYGGSGRHKAVAVREKSLPDFVVYRPMNIDAAMTVGRPGMFATGQPKKEKLPVLIFCNGGCMDTSIGYENMLTDIASYGYVVVAIGELQMMAQHEKDQHTPSSMVKRALDWICSPASPYYNYIDTEKIAAAGHSCGGAQVLANAVDPRLKTYLILNAGMGKMTMADASAKSLKNLHGPILYLVGGTSDVAWQNAQQDYKAIKRVPVVLADNTQSGHGGTYEQPNGGANARMVRAWLDWQLKGRQENERLFIGGDLTGYDGFTIQHKNYK
jgi:acetyl esterase/lipase